MVDKFILFFIMSFLVVGCSHPTTELNESNTKLEMKNMTNDEKNAFDKQYLNDLIDIDISEKDFFNSGHKSFIKLYKSYENLKLYH